MRFKSIVSNTQNLGFLFYFEMPNRFSPPRRPRRPFSFFLSFPSVVISPSLSPGQVLRDPLSLAVSMFYWKHQEKRAAPYKYMKRFRQEEMGAFSDRHRAHIHVFSSQVRLYTCRFFISFKSPVFNSIACVPVCVSYLNGCLNYLPSPPSPSPFPSPFPSPSPPPLQ